MLKLAPEKLRLWSVLFGFAICGFSYAQQPNNYFATYFDVSNGLSNNYVTKITEDDFGFKWIATEGGLNKYDGTSFINHKPSNTAALANENIEIVFKHSDGNLWIGTKSGGLTYYDLKADQFKNLNYLFTSDSTEKIRVTSISEDAKGRIFMGTWGKGLFIIDPTGKEEVRRLNSISSITETCSDSYGNVWIVIGKQLLKYDPSEDRLIKINEIGGITSLHFDDQRKRIWIGRSSLRLGYLDFADYQFHEIEVGIKLAHHVESIASDPSGKLWLGTWGGGLYMSDTSATKFVRYPLIQNTLQLSNSSYESILDIHCDKNGIIWISTAFGGFVKLQPVNNFNYLNKSVSESTGLKDVNINAVYIDLADRIWCGTYGAGLYLSQDVKSFQFVEGVPATKINVLLQVGDLMLVGSREGLYGVDVKNPTKSGVILRPSLSKITTLLITKNQELWIGTQQDGIHIIDLKSRPNENIVNQINRGTIRSWMGTDRISKFIEDELGNIWIGTFNGLYRYNGTDFEYIDEMIKGAFPSVIINDMVLDSATSTIWLAMPGGLVQLPITDGQVDTLYIHGQDEGLKNDFVTSVLKAESEDIWVGTAYGVSRYLTEKGVFVNYGNSEGVPHLSLNIKSIIADQDGTIYMGASDGLVYFNPSQIFEQQKAPDVVFTGLKINGELVSVGERIEEEIILQRALPFTDQIDLSYREKVFSFTIAPSDYLGNENIIYSYRLVGFKNEWIRFSNRQEIGFTNLKPGDYTLEVKASRDSYNWGKIAQKKLSISTPPWATWYAYLIYTGILIGLGLLISYISMRQASLSARLEIERIGREKEHDLSEAKITFFTNISHEFRTPLTLILSPLSELLMKKELDGWVRSKLVIIEKNASRLLHLINQLLDFRKSENGLLQLQVANGDFVQFAREVCLSFQHISKSKDIKYKIPSASKSIRLPFDRDKMEIVIVNLLSNAFKYTPANGTISVDIAQNGNYCELVVSNTGVGINPEELERVFDRFYQIRSTESVAMVGSGIGLSLSRNIVDLHHGKISVSSTPNKITEFKVELLIENELLKSEDYLVDFKNSDDSRNYPISQLDKSDPEGSFADLLKQDKDNVLVVDDNDDIRAYLTSILSEDYYVSSVKNGVEALQFAVDKHPDLIISDIMMPEMDGITLCEKIKNDVNTSHIPVILLTARTSTVFEVNSLQTGADDYIKKPFHPSVVKMRVSSLLENRKKLRNYFVNKLRFEPSQDIEAPNFEEEFIQKAITIIEDNIHDPDFGLDHMMDKLAMSQSTLYRKIKSLTGLSITAFIRSVRLKKAATLILTEDWKLSQVAYEVGFNDYKYFKSSFQEQFGCLPSEYKIRMVGEAK